MNRLELKRLIKIEDRVAQIASEDLGLKFHPIEFDIIPPQKMLEIMAYHIPTNISSWKYGRDYERERTKYEHGEQGLPYEVVINSNPAKAYLMTNNKFAVQCLVMAHVYGHCAFFTMNRYFKDSRQDIVGILYEASRRFKLYEKKYGIEEVEKTVDAGHALQWHSSPFESSETEQEKRLRIFEQLKKEAHIAGGDYRDITGSSEPKVNEDIELYNQKLWRKLKLKTPVEPTEDILRYIIDNSYILEDWQKDVLEVLRMEGQYRWPQIKTKFMNEGFACITGNSLVITENGFVPIIQAEEYCEKVVGIDNKLVDVGKRFVTDKVPTVIIDTNIGLKLEGAELHRVLALVNNLEEDVFLKDLKLGDKLIIALGANIWPERYISIDTSVCKWHQQFSRSKPIMLPDNIDEEIAYLFGAIIAEGNFTGGDRGITFSNDDLEYLERIKSIYKSKFNMEVDIKPRKDRNGFRITAHSTTLVEFFNQCGFSCNKSNKKVIPWAILQSPKEVVSAFIAGFFDGDGSMCYDGKYSKQLVFTSKSEELIRQLSIVLLNYGIIGHFRINRKKGYNDCYQLCVGSGTALKIFQKNIKFKDRNKKKLLNEAIKSIKWSYEIKNTCIVTSISQGQSINYDWEIPDGNHYIAQGFINHNTMVHQKIMAQLFEEGLLSTSEHGDYNYSNSLVKAQNPYQLNPYYLGAGIWKDIENRWDKGCHGVEWENCTNIKKKEEWDTKEMVGWQKCLDVMETYIDWFFMYDFLIPKVIQDLKIYLYKAEDKGDFIDFVIDAAEAEEIREKIVNYFSRNLIPKILVNNGNWNDAGWLQLLHQYDGVPLDKFYAEKTMAHVAYLWGKPVIIDTKTENNGNESLESWKVNPEGWEKEKEVEKEGEEEDDK